MGRKSLFGGGGTIGHIKGGAKLADYISTSHDQANNSTLKVRRSSRLRKITVVYESEAAKLVNLSLKHHQKISTHTCVSSTKQAKIERPSYNQMLSSSNQYTDVLDAVDTDDESTVNITLRDMFTRCTTKKRKASKFNAQSNADMQETNIASMIPKEVELEETLFSLKEKKRKSSSTGKKLNKISKSAFNSSPVEKKPLKTFSLASVAAEGGLGEAALKGTNSDELLANSDELLANSDVGLRHKIENINVKLKAFDEQSPLSVRSPKSDFDLKKEIIETCLDKSNNDNCTVNSSSAFIIKCDFDNICSGEGPDNGIEREDWGQPGCVTNNFMNPFARDIIEQSSHELSSAPSIDTQEISSHEVVNANNEILIFCTAKCENTAPSVGSVAKLKNKIHEKDDQHELQFEEPVSFNKESIHLIAAENSSEFFKSDHEKLTCSLENDRWLDRNKKHNSSDLPCNKIIPLVSEFMASSSYDDIDGSIVDTVDTLSTENHLSFVNKMKHVNMDGNSSLAAINSPKSSDVGEDGEYNMVYGDFDEQVRESMQSASTSAANNNTQMDCSFLPRKTVALVDTCSITEAGSSYVSTRGEVGKQASQNNGDSDCNLTTTYFLLNADEWAPHPDKLLASSQEHMLSRRLENQPCCVNYTDLSYEAPSEGIICHFSASQRHEIDAISQGKLNDGLSKTASMDTGTDLPISSSLESSSKAYVERQITNMLTTEIQTTDNMFGGNQSMKAEHCTKKLLSNRKEISPISQEKLIRALNDGGLDDVVKLSSNGETFLGSEHMIKRPKTMNQSLPEVTKGILKSPYGSCGNPCCLENSSIHAQSHDAILFSQRQMQDTENIAAKLLNGLNSLKSIVEETLFSGPYSFPASFNFDEIRLATKHASKLEVTTKKWLAMMAKDCTRFCKIMRLSENKFVSPVSDLHKGRRKITFADEAGGTLCHVKVYDQQPVAFIVPKS